MADLQSPEVLDQGLINLDYALKIASEAAKAAGELIMKTWNTPRGTSTVTDKSVASIDLVTETDKQCEALIMTMLKVEFPKFEMLGEETASENGGYSLTDAPTWIIDPIDGTTNFVHRACEVTVSIGLSINKKPVVGVMLDPIRNELYTARLGGGSFMNGKPIKVDQQATTLSEAIVGTNIGYGRDPTTISHMTNTISNLMKNNLRGMRMSGGCVFSLAQIASGRMTAFYECGPHPWDVCAAATIIIEGGGVVMDMTGEAFDLCSRRYLLANNITIANKILECIHQPIPQFKTSNKL